MVPNVNIYKRPLAAKIITTIVYFTIITFSEKELTTALSDFL